MSAENTSGRLSPDPFPICWEQGVGRADCQGKAEALTREFGYSLRDEAPASMNREEYPLVLFTTPGGLELRLTGKNAPGPVRVDFASGETLRRATTATRRQPLARAIFQVKATEMEAGITILDATAGLGRDAYVLAWLGAEVIAVERSPVLYALLRDGLERGKEEEVAREVLENRFHLLHKDAGRLLASPGFQAPEVIYLDPMYPPKRKESAAVKKELRVLQILLGPEADSDAASLLESAIQKARKRVVVKRPSYAPALGGKPNFEVRGKLVRYDVYLCGNR
ncbi:MAG: class I SAM-dependent methyltransferase [Planctomycetes bacterium]|nr:class I SAM-dependent methyltransferase [Planctomycetota bacterium]